MFLSDGVQLSFDFLYQAVATEQTDSNVGCQWIATLDERNFWMRFCREEPVDTAKKVNRFEVTREHSSFIP